MDPDLARAEALRRRAGSKLFIEYNKVWDPAQPDLPGAYPFQRDFHNASDRYPERLLMAGNRVGKTQCAAAEVACHLTGCYPAWWTGRRFHEPTRGWTGAERTEDSKEVVQMALLGPEGEHGTGWIPRDRIVDITYRQAGVSSVVDSIKVRHKSGGVSSVTLKTYQMEAKGWRGAKLHFIWLDEECKQDIFTECQTRVLDLKGLVFMTFTPLLGPTQVVQHFMDAEEGSGIYVKNVSWDDAPHLDPDEKERLWKSYPPHERDARAKGTPMLGSGAVFPIGDDEITCDPFELPAHFYRITGVDFGIDHPGAGAFCAWDKDADTFYVYDCYKIAGQTPVYHATALKKHGDWIPIAWPHDGMIRDKGSGKALKDQYRSHGLYMLREHAHYLDERGNHREPGVIEMYEWMRTGRFKVFSPLSQWLEEKRLYHRKDGQIVAMKDDLLSATRMAFIMRRYARHAPAPKVVKRKFTRPILGGRKRVQTSMGV
jgi:phage terminase large subunit-like protein